ncbi:MAG: hypothetical protein HYX40_04815, partial [Sphingobacteriales bacterium]|nr:hypothetical protein [Sphingobacteriales bacterium]
MKPHTFIPLRYVLVLLLLITASFVQAQTATVSTDRLDYPPGDTAYITGSGFAPGEIVTLQVHHIDMGTVSLGTDPQYHQPWTTVADSLGNISTTWWVPNDGDALGATFLLTADGQTSLYYATWEFTDSPRVGSVTIGSQTGTIYATSSCIATYNVTVNRGTGSGSNGTFSATICISGLPAGVTASPLSISLASADNSKSGILTLTGSASAIAGVTNFTVTAHTGNNCTTINGDNATTTGSITITSLPTATISYNGTPFCSNGGTATVTRTGTAGGTYSSTAGLSIDPSTGSITLGTSTAGTYTVSYSVTSGGCTVVIASTSVTITTLPSATISYSGTPYCLNGGNAIVTRTGTAGGTFSSTAGLSIDASTGSITLGTSTPGTYTVSYSFLPTGGCPQVTTTTSVKINPLPTPSITATENSGNTANDGTICNGSSVTLGTSIAYTSYSWSTGATTSSISVS